jgi:hypothetical protein
MEEANGLFSNRVMSLIEDGVSADWLGDMTHSTERTPHIPIAEWRGSESASRNWHSKPYISPRAKRMRTCSRAAVPGGVISTAPEPSYALSTRGPAAKSVAAALGLVPFRN